MTLLQIKYALLCAKYQSLAKAAEELYITPPNLSKSIKALEEELQYPIFIRSSKGMRPTEKGSRFLMLAIQMMENYEAMLTLGSGENDNVLSFTCNQVPFCIKAYNDFCMEHQADSQVLLTMHQGNYAYCVEKLKQFKCKMAILSFLDGNESIYLCDLQALGFTSEKIGEANVTLMMREEHPLLQCCIHTDDEQLLSDETVVQQLYQYPYINYDLDDYHDDILNPFQIGSNRWPVNPNKIITVNSMKQKEELIRATDGFAFTASRFSKTTNVDGIFYFPETTLKFRYFVVYPSKEKLGSFSREFIERVKEILND